MCCWCSKPDNKDIPRCACVDDMIWTCTMQSDCPGGGAEAKTLNTQHRMGVNMPSQARSPQSPHWGVTMTMAMMAYLGSTTTLRNRKTQTGGLNYFCHMLFLMSIKRSNWTLSSSMMQHLFDNKMVPSQYSKHQISSRIKCSSSLSSGILPGLEHTGWLSRFITWWNIVMDQRGKTEVSRNWFCGAVIKSWLSPDADLSRMFTHFRSNTFAATVSKLPPSFVTHMTWSWW